MKGTPEWENLLARHLDGQATAADMARLNERLRTDSEARSEFAEMLNLDSALAAMAASAQPAAVRSARLIIVAGPKLLALAALFAVLATSAFFFFTPRAPFATVLSSAGSGLTEGIVIHGEAQELQAGTVELLTQKGARVVIEAPAAFRFESAQRLHLLHGRAAAEVPPTAKGFTIVTPKGDAVDIGTKFGVDVTTQGASEIHVFQGEVIAQPKGSGGRHQSLRDGEALTLQPGPGPALAPRPTAFIRSDEMAALSAGLTAGQKARSESTLDALRHDPALISLLDFESADPLPGTSRLVQGRWPGSRAPEFVNVGDHMKLNVGGDKAWSQLTLAAWVRLDRLGEPYQSLYHTDGWQEDKPGQVHWMINRDTTMRLALRHNIQASGSLQYDADSDSLTPVLPERGRWVHLATVYDANARTVRFYLNGEFDKEALLKTAHPARLGSAQIGNWNQTDRKLSGRVDEFILLGRAMTYAEVRALHAAGNPYR